MTFKAKILLALGTFAIVAIIGIVQYIGRSTNETKTKNTNTANTSVANKNANTSIVTPTPSSDINAVVDALVAGATAESGQVFSETITETSLTEDSQNLQTYGQSYDENEL